MTHDIILPPMSRRARELLYLLTSNHSNQIHMEKWPVVIRYEIFEDIAPSLSKRLNIHVALAEVRPILRMYGFYITCVTNVGYICHKSILHTPAKFDRKFFGARKINELAKG